MLPNIPYKSLSLPGINDTLDVTCFLSYGLPSRSLELFERLYLAGIFLSNLAVSGL